MKRYEKLLESDLCHEKFKKTTMDSGKKNKKNNGYGKISGNVDSGKGKTQLIQEKFRKTQMNSGKKR